MSLKSLSCYLLIAVGTLAGNPWLPSHDAGSVWAADQKDAPAGTWNRKNGQLTLEFGGNNVLKIAPHGDRVAIAIVCDYSIDKEGLIKAKVTKLEADNDEIRKKLEEHAPVGLTFRFRWAAKGETAKLEDLMGDKTDTLNAHLSGEFEKKK